MPRAAQARRCPNQGKAMLKVALGQFAVSRVWEENAHAVGAARALGAIGRRREAACREHVQEDVAADSDEGRPALDGLVEQRSQRAQPRSNQLERDRADALNGPQPQRRSLFGGLHAPALSRGTDK